MSRTWHRLRLAFALLLLLPIAARADEDPNTERARSHVKAAVAYYDEARYEDAAREMEAAYRLRPLPDLQYNLAQCYERLGRLRDAVEAYRKYLDGLPSADDRAMIEARMKNLEQRVEHENVAGKEAPPPVEKVVLRTVVVYREPPPLPGRYARYVSYGLGVIAVGALASGVTFSVLARGDADAVSKGGDPTNPVIFNGKAASTQAAGQQDQVLGWVSFGVAGAAAIGAVGLYYLGSRIDREAQKLAVAPNLSPTSAGLVLSGSF